MANNDNVEVMCIHCGKTKPKLMSNNRNNFYLSDSPLFKHHGVIPVCKDCFAKLHNNFIEMFEGDIEKATKALCAQLDICFYEPAYDVAFQEYKNKKKVFIGSYMKAINSIMRKSLPQTTFDYKDFIVSKEMNTANKVRINQEDLRLNKSDIEVKEDIINMLSHDPFAGFPEKDQKFLYGELAGYLGQDQDLINDPFKLSQLITILKTNNQVRDFDFAISNASANANEMLENQQQLKMLIDNKKNLATVINTLAKENGIAANHRGDKKAGKSTLGSMMVELRKLGFEDAEVDFYDVNKARGMKHVADISNKSILEQLNFDEKDVKDMFFMQKERIQKLEEELADTKDKLRVEARKNMDEIFIEDKIEEYEDE